MRRLNFLEDEPWDEVHDHERIRVRWFGHPLGADMLGASLTELLPGSPGYQLHMHYGGGDADRPHSEGRGAAFARRRRLLRRGAGRAAHLLKPDGRASTAARHLDQAVSRRRGLSGAGGCLGGYASSRTPSARGR